MKYYNIRITNLGMGWFKWTPMYRNFDRKYFWWLNWRVDWKVTTDSISDASLLDELGEDL